MSPRDTAGAALALVADDDVVAHTAAMLVQARASNLVLTDWPARLPRDLAEGYAIQDCAIMGQGAAIGGWKVGRIPADLIATHGTDRLTGPILRDAIVIAGDAQPDMPVLDGFAAAEGEILIRLARLPDRGASLAQIAACVADLRLGIEIASSPFVGINQHGPAVTVADFGNNYGLVVGPHIPGWQGIDLLSVPVRTRIDGAVIGEARLAEMLDGPFGAVGFLVENLRQRGHMIGPDDWISTGAITGVHDVVAGQQVTVSFGDLAQVACRTVTFASADLSARSA